MFRFASFSPLPSAMVLVALAGCGSRPAEIETSDPLLVSSEWGVDFDGIGPVHIGMRIGAVQQMLGGTVRVERIEDGEACGFAYFSEVPSGIAFMVEDDTIVRVDVDTLGYLTRDGHGVGTPESVLRDFFGSRLRVEEHPYEGPIGHYLIVDGPTRPTRRMIFETDGAVVTRYRSGRIPDVDLIEGCA